MSEQSTALRLAELLEAAPAHTLEDGTITLYLGGTVVADKAAAELRRLHNEVEVLKRIIENCKVVSDATAEGWRLDQEKLDAVKVARDTMGELWAKEKAHNAELVEALRSTGLFLHHLWCDVQMNDYSFQKLNEQMEIVDKVLKK